MLILVVVVVVVVAVRSLHVESRARFPSRRAVVSSGDDVSGVTGEDTRGVYKTTVTQRLTWVLYVSYVRI